MHNVIFLRPVFILARRRHPRMPDVPPLTEYVVGCDGDSILYSSGIDQAQYWDRGTDAYDVAASLTEHALEIVMVTDESIAAERSRVTSELSERMKYWLSQPGNGLEF